MVRVGDFGSKVLFAVQQEVLAPEEHCGGQGSPFLRRHTAVRDNEGHEASARGQALGDAQILGMHWLVEGVQGKLVR